MLDFFAPSLPERTIYHIGVSGGKDSAAVLLWMVYESGIPLEKLDVTFCDTDNEHDLTYAHIQLLSERVFPIQTILPDLGFFDLAWKKQRFPSRMARFCTEHLKIRPTMRHINGLMTAAQKVVSVSGVRGDESDERALLNEWDYSNALLTLQWRPLIKWTIQDVLAIHKKYGIPLNPLYGLGAERVGCYPCINSKKKEIRTIAIHFPDRIDQIRDWEQRFETERGRYSSFFASNTVPPRFRTKEFITKDGVKHMVCTIDDVVKWSMTGHRAKGSYRDDPPEPISCMSGFCE